MMRGYRWLVFSFAFAISLFGQDRRSHIEVQHYTIDAQVNPRTQTLTATAKIEFTPLETANDVTFELNNALTVSKAADGQGASIATSRGTADFSVRVMMPGGITKNQPTMISLTYDGKLTGDEDSPVPGIRFAALHPDFGYLLYPSRWFPINNYSVNRFAMDLNITTPEGYRVVASGDMKTTTASDGGTVSSFHYEHISFPGSVGIVKSEPARISSEGIDTQVYFRGEHAAMAQAYGDETGKIMTFFTGTYGLAPQARLTLVETEAGSVNGYSAPGIIFLSPGSITKPLNVRVLSDQLSRQWWSPGLAHQSKSFVA